MKPSHSKIIRHFLDDAASVLCEYEEKLHKNLARDTFYIDDMMGLQVEHNTETNLVFLLFIELCDRYKLWYEKSYPGKSKERVDLALYTRKPPTWDDGDFKDCIYLEFKWFNPRDDGFSKKASQKLMAPDLHKLVKSPAAAEKCFVLISFSKLERKEFLKALVDLESSIPRDEGFEINRIHVTQGFRSYSNDAEEPDEYGYLTAWTVS